MEDGDKTNNQDDALQRLDRQLNLEKLARQMRLSSFLPTQQNQLPRPGPSKEPEKPTSPQPLRRLDFSLAQFEELKEVIIIERTIGIYVSRERANSPKDERLAIVRCAYVIPASWS